MQHFFERANYVNPFLVALNHELERPLSLLMINARDIEKILEWEKWLRRVAIFTDNHKTYYHLVATATGLDFYLRFNFKLFSTEWKSIPSHKQIIWPFDIINITLDQDSIDKGLLTPQSWKYLLSAQLLYSERFLLVVQGETSFVNKTQQILENLQNDNNIYMTTKQLSYKTFQSVKVPAAIRVWEVKNKPMVLKDRDYTQEELERITEILLWGEDDI